LTAGYNSPIEEVLRIVIKQITQEVINEKYNEQIRTSIVNHLEKTIGQGAIDKITSTAIEKLRREVEDSYT
jgi:hypothetical protein